jgi:hypothetical protein
VKTRYSYDRSLLLCVAYWRNPLAYLENRRQTTATRISRPTPVRHLTAGPTLLASSSQARKGGAWLGRALRWPVSAGYGRSHFRGRLPTVAAQRLERSYDGSGGLRSSSTRRRERQPLRSIDQGAPAPFRASMPGAPTLGSRCLPARLDAPG